VNVKFYLKNLFYLMRKQIIASSCPIFLVYLRYFYKSRCKAERWMEMLFSHQSKRTVLQIGANDGFVNDPLYKFVKKYRLNGIVVEPQPRANSILKQIYQKDQIKVIQAAIDRNNGESILYQLSFSDDRWASGLSSFIKENLEKVIESGMVQKKAKKYKIKLPVDKSSWIKAVNVKTINFETLLQSDNVHQINLLLIDTEGFDCEIIKMFDFTKFRPELVIFEQTHIDETELSICLNNLKQLGYDIEIEKPNCIAVHTSFKQNYD